VKPTFFANVAIGVTELSTLIGAVFFLDFLIVLSFVNTEAQDLFVKTLMIMTLGAGLAVISHLFRRHLQFMLRMYLYESRKSVQVPEVIQRRLSNLNHYSFFVGMVLVLFSGTLFISAFVYFSKYV
jgi:hypothetical protein